MSLELFIQTQPLRVSSYVHSCPCLRTLLEYSPLKCLPMLLVSTSGPTLQLLRAAPLNSTAREPSNTNMSYESNYNSYSHYDEDLREVREGNYHHCEPVVTCNIKETKESVRRRKIGLANKGKVPWNKGKKHKPETLARIRERTVEALSDPKVRSKMSAAPRMHSAQSKEKIGSSLKQLWAKRLRRKCLTEKFYSFWAESIAEAARRGGINEEELNWDSYETLKEKIASRQRQHVAEKAKKKESKRIRAEKTAQERAKKMASQVREKMDHTQKDSRKGKRRARLPTDSRELNSKARLTKVNGKNVTNGAFCSNAGVMLYLESALEKLDIDSIKKELRRTKVSLSDQIQAAKRKRTEAMANTSPTTLRS